MMLAALNGLEKSAAGTQVLTLFQSDQLREAPATILNSARDLLEAHRRLKPVAADQLSHSDFSLQNLDGPRKP